MRNLGRNTLRIPGRNYCMNLGMILNRLCHFAFFQIFGQKTFQYNAVITGAYSSWETVRSYLLLSTSPLGLGLPLYNLVLFKHFHSYLCWRAFFSLSYLLRNSLWKSFRQSFRICLRVSQKVTQILLWKLLQRFVPKFSQIFFHEFVQNLSRDSFGNFLQRLK